MKIPSVGKLLISGVAAFTAVGAYLYDYNETHMFNRQWPPHAKFHDAQTISLGSLLGFLSLWSLWRAPFDQGARLRVATVLASCSKSVTRRACFSRTLRWSTLNLRQRFRSCSADLPRSRCWT